MGMVLITRTNAVPTQPTTTVLDRQGSRVKRVCSADYPSYWLRRPHGPFELRPRCNPPQRRPRHGRADQARPLARLALFRHCGESGTAGAGSAHPMNWRSPERLVDCHALTPVVVPQAVYM